MLYFAYCTLLDNEEMKKHCPTAKPQGILRLPGYRLSFATYSPNPSEGGCTLEKVKGHDLYGVLYEVTTQEMEALDLASGHDRGCWKRIKVELIGLKQEKVTADTYLIPNPCGPYHPPASYTEPILRGARAFHLPQEYIGELERIIEAAQGRSQR